MTPAIGQWLNFPRVPAGWPTTGVTVWMGTAGTPTEDDSAVLHVLTRATGIAADRLRIGRDGRGRRTIAFTDNLPNPPPLDLCISRNGNLLLVGVSQVGRIGLDVEWVEQKEFDPTAVIRNLFTPDEQNRLDAMAPADRIYAFYASWTAKEAMAKALGFGMSFDLREIEIGEEPIGFPFFLRLSGSATLAQGWLLARREIIEPHRRAVLTLALGPK